MKKFAAPSENGLSVSPAQEKILQKQLAIIDDGRTKMTVGAMQIGGALIIVKEVLEHGEFIPWVQDNCWFSARSAQVYIQMYEAFGKSAVAAHLDQDAMRILAPCEPAVAKAKTLMNKGFRIGIEQAKQLVEECKPGKDEEPEGGEIAIDERRPDPSWRPLENAPPQREPGDDTDAIADDKAKQKAAKAKPPTGERLAGLQVPYRAALQDLTNLLCTLRPLLEDDAHRHFHHFQNAIEVGTREMKSTIKQAMPYSLCPFCSGKGCPKCLQTGWITRATYLSIGSTMQAKCKVEEMEEVEA